MTRGTGATAEADIPPHPPSVDDGGDSGGDGGRDQSGGGTGRPGRSPARRRWWLVVLAVGVLAAGAVITLLVTDGGDDEDASAPPASTPVPDDVGPRLDAEGTELGDLLATGRDAEIHATYVASGDQEGMTIELWRKDGLVRQDTHIETEAGSADTAGFLLGDGETVSCVRRDAGEWTCSASEADASPDGIFGTVLQQLGGLDVVARDGTIDGREVRCFEFGATDGDGEICVSLDGIPVRATVGASSIVLSDLETSVDADVFEVPAEITSAPE